MRRSAFVLALLVSGLSAAPANRITRPVDSRSVRALSGGVHRLAQRAFDRGAVEPGLRLDHIVAMIKPSPSQQAELDQLLADQQNPSSPGYRKWLTPEEYGARFGLSSADHSKVVAWLQSEGFQVKESARSRNWVAFSGTAAQVERTLRTPIHRYEVGGEPHIANAAAPSVPEALADVIDGFIGLDDFKLWSHAKVTQPNFTAGGFHYLAPEDFATIYNLKPLYQAGLDGTGQSIAIVGQSAVSLSDMRQFRTRFGLPANDPKMILYSTTDPGFTSAETEGDLDLQWAGAIAPKATLYYVYGTSAFSAYLYAVTQNIAPIISISYGGCETDYRPFYYRSIGQQANAQGITVLVSSGDSGSACDRQGTAVASMGSTAVFPAALPEVTAVGGTQFVEGSGNYWAASNSTTGGSALSYIPEAAWNESSVSNGILASGGGVSRLQPKPVWQHAAGLADNPFRQYPDVSLTAALHDGYLVVSDGGLYSVGGTSASAPAMAGVVALLNQSQMAKGAQSQPGLGNINPQLYRLAEAAPSVYHDIVAGDNLVPCAQGSPDCLTGTIGDRAGAGYDRATGLGSIDANELINHWSDAPKRATVRLILTPTRATLNDTVDATALVTGDGGTPSGRVEFSINGTPLGSATLEDRGGQGQAADITFPVYQLGGTGTATVSAMYSGDAAFGASGATRSVTITSGTGAAAITVSAPYTVWPMFPDQQGAGWQTSLVLRDLGGAPSIVTGFRIDGEAQPLATYFPTPNIAANGSLTVNLVFRKLVTPLLRKFDIMGVDATGKTWSRTVSVNYLGWPSSTGFFLSATPLTVSRNAADPACQWPVQVSIDALDGRGDTISGFYVGTVSRTSEIAAVFGTDRLQPWGSLQGTVCLNDVATPSTAYIEVDGASGFVQEVLVTFRDAPAAPSKATATPDTVTLRTPGTAQATVALAMEKGQPWTVAVYPANRTAGWLTVTPTSGVGPAQLTLSAKGDGYGPGAYRAQLLIQMPMAMPQTVTVPVMFVLGAGGSDMTISSVANSFSGKNAGAPGGLLSIFGTGLAKATDTAAVRSAIPSALAGVSVAINGIAAPVLYASPTQINVQVPFEVGAGPAVVGVTNENGVAGAMFPMAPAAPGIWVDGDGMLAPQKELEAGKVATLYVTGAGEVSGGMPTAFATSATSSLASGPKPLLPVAITIDGAPAFLQTVGVAPGQVGVVQVNFVAPATPGKHGVAVSVGGAASETVYFNVK